MASDSELTELRSKLDGKIRELEEAKSDRRTYYSRLDALRSELDDAFKKQNLASREVGASARALLILRSDTEPLIRNIETRYDAALDASDERREQGERAQASGDTDTAQRMMAEAEVHSHAARGLNRNRKRLVKAIMQAQDTKRAREATFSTLRHEYKMARGRMNEGINLATQSQIKCERLTIACEELRRSYHNALANRIVTLHP